MFKWETTTFSLRDPKGGEAGKQKVCSQTMRQKYRAENKKNFKKLNYFIKIKAVFRTKCYFCYS